MFQRIREIIVLQWIKHGHTRNSSDHTWNKDLMKLFGEVSLYTWVIAAAPSVM